MSLLVKLIEYREKLRAKRMNTKGQLGNLQGLGIAVVSFVILMAAGALVLANFATNSTVAADSNATYMVAQGQNELINLFGWLGLIIILAVAALIFFLVKRGFGQRG